MEWMDYQKAYNHVPHSWFELMIHSIEHLRRSGTVSLAYFPSEGLCSQSGLEATQFRQTYIINEGCSKGVTYYLYYLA